MKSKMEIDRFGDKVWRNSKGQFHREDGPAIINEGCYREWLINDKIHRENGPAVEWNNGYKEWYLNDIRYTEEEYKRKMRFKKISDLLNN